MDKKFKVVIVEDVKLELKGTEEIFRNEIPDAEVIGTAMTEPDFWALMEQGLPDMVLLDFGESLNEKLWVDALDAGASGIVLKTGELLTRTEVQGVMEGKQWVFNQPILEKIVARFRQSVLAEAKRQQSVIDYDIDEYDERLLRHLALGYTKEMITNLKGMPFGVKSLEKRQNDLVNRLFASDERTGVNAVRLVVRALELGILNLNELEADEE